MCVGNAAAASPSKQLNIGNKKRMTINKKIPTPKSKGKWSTAELQLRTDEGVRLNKKGQHVVYEDSKGYLTAGIGHKITQAQLASGRYKEGMVVPQEQVDKWFEEDLKTANEDVDILYKGMNVQGVKRDVLVNMAFNMGRTKLAEFDSMEDFIRVGDNAGMRYEMENSIWWGQVKDRSKRLGKQIEDIPEEKKELDKAAFSPTLSARDSSKLYATPKKWQTDNDIKDVKGKVQPRNQTQQGNKGFGFYGPQVEQTEGSDPRTMTEYTIAQPLYKGGPETDMPSLYLGMPLKQYNEVLQGKISPETQKGAKAAALNRISSGKSIYRQSDEEDVEVPTK
jgi:GH24 family phage-related lysozyme (muramidase)